MQKTNTALILKLAAVAAAFSVQGAVLAQIASSPATSAPVVQTTNATPDAKHEGHKHWRHKHGKRHHHFHAAMQVPGYGALGEKTVEALKLNEEQNKLLQEARDAQKAERKERFEAFKETRQARLEAVKAGTLDPHAALKESEEARSAALESREKVTEKWLAVWDSLDDAQHKQVAQHFADRAEKRAEFMKKRAERRAAKQAEKAAAEKSETSKS